MKKLVLYVFALFPSLGFGQLIMTPDGIKGSDAKEYIVIESNGESQSDLYSKSLTYLQGIFNSPNHALSTVDGQSITVNGFQPSAIKSRYKQLKANYDLRYSATFEFKDGRVKFQVNNWEAGFLTNVGDYKVFRDYYGVYNEKLELQNPTAKEHLEAYFNGFVSLYEKQVLEKEDW
jgi:hypothetical protein